MVVSAHDERTVASLHRGGWALVRGSDDRQLLVAHSVLMDYGVSAQARRDQGEPPLTFLEWLEVGTSPLVHHDGPVTFH